MHIFLFKEALLVCAGRVVSAERREGSAHPLVALPGVRQHLLQGANRQRLLQHKVADAQVRRDILQERKEEQKSETQRGGQKRNH